MDPISQARFDAILAKDISALTENDKSFLRSRKTYIPNRKQQELRSILGGSDLVVEPVVEKTRAEWSEHPADTEEQTESVTEGDEDAEGQVIIDEDNEDDEAEG